MALFKRPAASPSLPRPEELIQIMYAKEEGKPVDRLLLAAQVRAAVAAVVAKQRKSGVAISARAAGQQYYTSPRPGLLPWPLRAQHLHDARRKRSTGFARCGADVGGLAR
jgi:hypothetical protein